MKIKGRALLWAKSLFGLIDLVFRVTKFGWVVAISVAWFGKNVHYNGTWIFGAKAQWTFPLHLASIVRN